MNREQFDEIWEMASVERQARKMAAGYTAWRTRQRRRAAMAAMLLILIGLAIPLSRISKGGQGENADYITAYCNKNDIADQYWIDLAQDMLLESSVI